MALCCIPSLPSVICPRRYPSINPLPAVFFHRAFFSKSLKIFVSTNGDRNGSAPRIPHVRSSADPSSIEEMNPPSSRIFVKGKRKMVEIEEQKEYWESIQSSEDEAGARDRNIQYADESNEDPNSEDSADNL